MTVTVYVRTVPHPIPKEHGVTQSLGRSKINGVKATVTGGKMDGHLQLRHWCRAQPSSTNLGYKFSGSWSEMRTDFTSLVLNTSVTLSPFSRRRPCLCLCSARAPWEGQSSPSTSTPQPCVHGSHEPGANSHHLLTAPSGGDTASQCALLSCCSHRLWGCALPLLNAHKCVSRHPSPLPTSHPLCWPTTALTWGQHRPLSTHEGTTTYYTSTYSGSSDL